MAIQNDGNAYKILKKNVVRFSTEVPSFLPSFKPIGTTIEKEINIDKSESNNDHPTFFLMIDKTDSFV